MNSACTQTNLVLDGFFALLACGKCKQTPERPVRFVTCGHFFCDSCVENDTVCRQCRAPVKSNEKRPHNTIAQLINYCKTIKEMISNLDAGDLWPLANAIHQLTTEQDEKIEETASRTNEVAKPAPVNETSKGHVSDTATESSVESMLRYEKNDSRPENINFLHSTKISQKRIENNTRPDESIEHSTRIDTNHEKNDSLTENVSFVESSQVPQNRVEKDLNLNSSFVHSTQVSKKREDNYLHPGNVSFVHSTQIIDRRGKDDVQTETPGYIDPTQISPIRRQSGYDSETPGYRDPTQAIQRLDDSNYDPDTPGYRDPTQISQDREKRNSAHETLEYVDPTQVAALGKKIKQALNSVPETEPASVANWQDDMELEVEDKDLFSPIAESSDDTLVPETLDMDVCISNGTIIPETLDVDVVAHDNRAALTVVNARDSPPETDKFTERDSTRNAERMKALQRKTYPMSVYDTVGICDNRESAKDTAVYAGKASLRFGRRSTDPTLDRHGYATDDFDTLSVPDERSSYVDDVDENEGPPVRQLRRIRNLALGKRQNRIVLNDLCRPSVDNAGDELEKALNRKEEVTKRDSRESSGDLRNTITGNDREKASVASVRDTRMMKETPKQLRRIRDLKLDRQNAILINPRETLAVEKAGNFSKETKDSFGSERVQDYDNESTVFENRDTIPIDDDERMGIDNVQDTETVEKEQSSRIGSTRDAILVRSNETVEVEKQRPLKKLRRLSDWEVDRQRRTLNNRETTRSPFRYNDAGSEKEDTIKPLSRLGNAMLDRQKDASSARETREFANTGNMKRGNRIGRIMNLALRRLIEDSLSDRDTMGLVDGADLVETAVFETQTIDEDPSIERRSKIPTIANEQDTAMEIEGIREDKPPPKHLQRLTDWPLNQHAGDSADETDTINVTGIGDSVMELVEIPEIRPLRRFEGPRVAKPANHIIRPNDLHDLDITNIQHFHKEKGSNECPRNESETVDVSNVGDLLEESEEVPKVKPLRQLRRLQKSKPDHRSIMECDLRDVDITNFQDFAKDKQQTACPLNESDTVDVSNVGDLLEESEKVPEVRPLRQLRRLQKSKPDHRSILASDLHGVDITNIQEFDKEKEANECPMNESDTVDVSNVGDLLGESEKVPEVRPLRQLRRLQKSKPDHRSILASDPHGVDVTNIQEFDKEKQAIECPMNESDTVDVSNVGDLLEESEKVPEVRPLRQLRRLRRSKPSHESAIPTNLRNIDTTNIDDSAKERASLVEKTPMRQENVGMKRPSKSPPNDYITAETSAMERSIENPSQQLGIAEDLEMDTQNKIPAKRAKAKVVQLKPRRRTNDKTTAVPKAVPKNVNKRNVKGETVLHNACVKGEADYVRSLLEAGANPNTKDNANWTPLQEVVKLGRREICEMLLQFGASPNTPGIENRTALHDASQNDKLEEATLLLRFNANRDVYDKYGKRPIDYALTDAMRALLADDNEVEKTIVEAPGLNATLDQSMVTPNTKVVVLPENLNSANKKALSRIAAKLKVTVAGSFRPGVTHIVVEANERNTTDLTHHIMFAILQGIWILNSQWIAISMDLNDISEIDLDLFEVHGAPNPGTPERARMNAEKQNPRLFNNCFFYFTIGARGTWNYGNLEFTKASLTKLVLAGQGEVLRREPDPEDVKENEITPFHVADKSTHSLHRCSHYIIYMPGRDEPRIKYNMPHIKSLPLAWLIECIEKFALVDPVLIGIS